jgi:AraC-like DNA-binding protein
MNFSRAFKSIYGIPPAKWREENRTFINKSWPPLRGVVWNGL